MYELFGGQYLTTLPITLQVYEEVVITVPAGTFDTFGIGVSPWVLTDGGTIQSLTGERLAAGRGTPPLRYYAENVGVVRDVADDTYDLLAYGFPVAVESASWARIKNLYR